MLPTVSVEHPIIYMSFDGILKRLLQQWWQKIIPQLNAALVMSKKAQKQDPKR